MLRWFLIASVALAACTDDDGASGGAPGGAGGAGASGGGAEGGTGGAGGGEGGAGGGSSGERFPLSIDPSGRFLREASGQPFLFNGDTGWSLIAQLSDEDAEIYLEDRRQKGFTVILVNLLEHAFSDDPPNNAYGEPPFTVSGDFSTPNEAYFAHADWVIARAADKGLLLALAPAYIGYGGGSEGFYQEMEASGVEALGAYGHFLGERYATSPNIMWVHGGDYNPPTPDLVDAIAEAIVSDTTLQLHTAHTNRNDTASNIWGQEPWLSVDNVYTDDEAHDPSLDLYAGATRPFFLIEAYYEGEHGMSPADLRYQAYGALLGGAMGHFFGNNPMWCLGSSNCFPTTAIPPTWQGQLDGRGSLDMAALGQIYRTIAWETLAPNDGLVSGPADGIAAADPGGTLALVYTRALGDLDIDLSGFGGDVEITRIDPTDASETAVAGSPFAPGGTETIALDTVNAGGDEDWVVRCGTL